LHLHLIHPEGVPAVAALVIAALVIAVMVIVAMVIVAMAIAVMVIEATVIAATVGAEVPTGDGVGDGVGLFTGAPPGPTRITTGVTRIPGVTRIMEAIHITGIILILIRMVTGIIIHLTRQMGAILILTHQMGAVLILTHPVRTSLILIIIKKLMCSLIAGPGFDRSGFLPANFSLFRVVRR